MIVVHLWEKFFKQTSQFKSNRWLGVFSVGAQILTKPLEWGFLHFLFHSKLQWLHYQQHSCIIVLRILLNWQISRLSWNGLAFYTDRGRVVTLLRRDSIFVRSAISVDNVFFFSMWERKKEFFFETLSRLSNKLLHLCNSTCGSQVIFQGPHHTRYLRTQYCDITILR